MPRATGTDGTSTTSSSSTDERIKTTMADLDALLGIQEEPEPTDTKVTGDGACMYACRGHGGDVAACAGHLVFA